MTEKDRLERNRARLAECYPVFAGRVARLIADLEQQGVRPRIQDAWRCSADQLKAFETGRSRLKFGLHNVTGTDGAKESLAVDLLDDDAPCNPSTEYLLKLAAAAIGHGLVTGIRWGLPPSLCSGVDAALESRDFVAPVKLGWDPSHVQVAGISAHAARCGRRPV